MEQFTALPKGFIILAILMALSLLLLAQFMLTIL